MQLQLINVLLLIVLLIVINFKDSDQFFKRIEVSKNIKRLGFNSMQQLQLSSNEFDNLNKNGVFEAYETVSQGIKLWERIENNYNKWNEEIMISNTSTVVEELSKKDLFNLLETEDKYEALLYDNTVPDVVASSVKNKPITEEEDLIATINFFVDYNCFSQLVCLMTLQNPPVETDQLLGIIGNDLTKLFEYLFMMNPDLLDMFFESDNKNYEYAIFSLLCCDKYVPAKFDELVEKIIHNYSTYQNLNIRNLAYACYGMYISAISFEKSENNFSRNEKLLTFLDSVISKSEYIEPSELYNGLEKGRELMSLILKNHGKNFITASEKHDDNSFDDIQYGPDQKVEETFKVIQNISNDYELKL